MTERLPNPKFFEKGCPPRGRAPQGAQTAIFMNDLQNRTPQPPRFNMFLNRKKGICLPNGFANDLFINRLDGWHADEPYFDPALLQKI